MHVYVLTFQLPVGRASVPKVIASTFPFGNTRQGFAGIALLLYIQVACLEGFARAALDMRTTRTLEIGIGLPFYRECVLPLPTVNPSAGLGMSNIKSQKHGVPIRFSV